MTSSEDTGAVGEPGFGDAAGEMANETEVEESPVTGDSSAPASAAYGDPAANPAAADDPDTSTAENMLEEGGPVVGTEETGASGADATAGPTLEDQLAERTSDLQRLSAEYANYRKRVDRDRGLIAENATYKALVPIIDVLDTIDRAKEAGEDDPGFHAVADQLANSVRQAGLIRFGEPGDVFDPNLHEALSHLGTDPDVSETTCKHIAKAGYRIGDRVVRAALVLVVDPAEA